MQRPGSSWGGQREVRLSKGLSYLLRHGAQKEGVKMTADGYCLVDEILARPRFAKEKYTVDEVKSAVQNNDKQRFTLQDREGKLYIKANQGHSIEVQDLSLAPVTDASSWPTVVHGTYYDCLPLILKDGLCRMSRTHIHFSIGQLGDKGVISGMRKNAEVYVHVDLAAALRDGYRFFVSENKVLLSPGDTKGYIPAKYFKDVIDVKSGNRVKQFTPLA